MSGTLAIRNHQRAVRIDTRDLRRLARDLLRNELQIQEFDLAIYFVRSEEITNLNETFLRHKGPTDVIAFDYLDRSATRASPLMPTNSHLSFDRRDACAQLHGEIFICVDEAISQARRFRATLKSELVRYIIHGVLHLIGYDDKSIPARRVMKREEDRLLRQFSRRFHLSKPARAPRLRR